MKHTQNATNPSFETTFNAKGEIVESEFWSSPIAQNNEDYITCEGGVVRRLMATLEVGLDESNAKIAMITIGTVTQDLGPHVPIGEEMLEIYYNSGDRNPLLSHHRTNLVEHICDLPDFGEVTDFELWDFYRGKPRLRLTLKCVITDGTVPNIVNILGSRRTSL